MIRFNSRLLAGEMRRSLEIRDVADESIEHVVTSLIQTSLRGVDSHGINLFPHYCKAVDAGRINKRPKFKIKKSSTAAALLDADDGFGHHAGADAMSLAVDMARRTGMGSVAVKNSTHFGAAGYFGLLAAKKDCLGFAFTNADALVKAYASKKPFFGTNPICITAPMKDEEPFCLDMATSLVSWNKIRNYRLSDKMIPPHWAFDAHGLPTSNPHQARCLNPIGEYKGFGLGMVVDIFCSLLSGGPISDDIMPMFAKYDRTKRQIGHFFMAIDISKFISPSVFKTNLQKMADRVRKLEPLKKGGQVMIAGDPEKINQKLRQRTGIPVDKLKLAEFLELSEGFRKAIVK